MRIKSCSGPRSYHEFGERVFASSNWDKGFPVHFCFIERFHSRDKPPYWYTQTKSDFCIKIEFNSKRTGLGLQYGRRFFVLEHQYGRRDVT